MATMVKCPYCGSYRTQKTSNGKFTDSLAKAGAVVGGALLQMATGIPGILGANVGYGRTWHQFCCHDCHESFKGRLGVGGYAKEVRIY